MNKLDHFATSIGKKQVVAITGLALVLFLIGHLAGNLFIYAGAEAFNAYAKKLADLRPGLLIVELGLLIIFLVHMMFTVLVVLENKKAAGRGRYAVNKSHGNQTISSKIMPYTGGILLAFVIWHLLDFTFSDHHGPRAFIEGKDYGLYGVVINSFKQPIHATLYILAMGSVGFHLMHGVQSVMQTFGFHHPKYTPVVKTISLVLGAAVALGFAAIPIYVMVAL